MDRRLYSKLQPATCDPERGGPCNSRASLGYPHTHMLLLLLLLNNWVPSSWVRSCLSHLDNLTFRRRALDLSSAIPAN